MTRRFPLFLRCSKRELEQIAAHGREAAYAPGDVLVAEGDEDRDFYALRSGRVLVTQGGETRRELERADFFGEISILAGGPRSATVTALTDVDALVVDEPTVRDLLERLPGLRRKVTAALAERLEPEEGR